jgi:hypothetical protein
MHTTYPILRPGRGDNDRRTDHDREQASRLAYRELTTGITVVLKTGHIGLLVGGSARKQTLPKVTAWLASADADGKDGVEADGKDGKDRR